MVIALVWVIALVAGCSLCGWGFRDGGTSVQRAPRCDAVMVQANHGRPFGPDAHWRKTPPRR
jgi:hypothetical protein